MPDLERWLTEIEGRHTEGVWVTIAGTHGEWCNECKQDWPCDTITLARVVREYRMAMHKLYLGELGIPSFEPQRDMPTYNQLAFMNETDQRIAAIISGEEASGE